MVHTPTLKNAVNKHDKSDTNVVDYYLCLVISLYAALSHANIR